MKYIRIIITNSISIDIYVDLKYIQRSKLNIARMTNYESNILLNAMTDGQTYMKYSQRNTFTLFYLKVRQHTL